MTDQLEVRDLVKRYGERTAVDGLSFRVAAGEVYGLLGPNGAGKTTAVRMVTGLLQPSSGSVLVAGFDPFAEPLAARAHLGWVGQELSLYEDLSAAENLRLAATLGLAALGGTLAYFVVFAAVTGTAAALVLRRRLA